MEDTTAIVEWVAHKARPQAKPRETTPAIGANTLPRAPTSAREMLEAAQDDWADRLQEFCDWM